MLVTSSLMQSLVTKTHFARQYREEIRTALGGVDELSISAGVTATEYKSLFGRVVSNMLRKKQMLFTPMASAVVLS